MEIKLLNYYKLLSKQVEKADVFRFRKDDVHHLPRPVHTLQHRPLPSIRELARPGDVTNL